MVIFFCCLLRSPTTTTDDEEGGHALFNALVGGAILMAMAVLVSAGMLHCISRCGRGLLFSSYGVFAGLWGVAAVIFAVLFNFVFAIVCAFLCALMVFLIRRRKHRIEFGAANLKVSSAELPVH